MESRARHGAARLFIASFGAWSAACAPAAAPAPGAPTAPAEPVAAFYTADQATRGQRTFTAICSTCHGRNDFVGPIFALTWRAEPVGNLFEQVSTNMPQDAPGSLTPQEYADVVAYILQMNGVAPGDRELPADRRLLAVMEW